jgi:hypothetical protein
MPKFLYWVSQDKQEEAKGPGIKYRVEGAPDEFPAKVRQALSALYETAPGKVVLDRLIKAAGAGKETLIFDTNRGNSCEYESPEALNKVALELYPDLATNVGPATQRALMNAIKGVKGKVEDAADNVDRKLAKNQDAKTEIALVKKATKKSDEDSAYYWLAAVINSTPNYVLKGEPAKGLHKIKNGPVTPDDVKGWFENGRQSTIWGKVENDPDCEYIKNAIIIALEPHSDPGKGAGSRIGWNIDDDFVMNKERPPVIGLAHELVHAFFNAKGRQPGWNVERPSTVLFEYKCVGLGPWKEAPISENAIRTEWRKVKAGFGDDELNNRDVPLRPVYSR